MLVYIRMRIYKREGGDKERGSERQCVYYKHELKNESESTLF